MFAQVSAVPLLQLWGVRKGEGLLKRTVVKNKGFGIGEGDPPRHFPAVEPRTIFLIFPSSVPPSTEPGW